MKASTNELFELFDDIKKVEELDKQLHRSLVHHFSTYLDLLVKESQQEQEEQAKTWEDKNYEENGN